MGSNVMDFMGAWDIVKGENPEIQYNHISIAIVDIDFTNAENLSDLWYNTYWSPGVGNGSGHGTWVASVASAENK